MKAAERFHLVMVDGGASSEVSVPGEPIDFFPDGLLAVRSGPVSLRRVVPSANTETLLYEHDGSMVQVTLSHDGTSAAFADVSRASVVRVSLATGRASRVATDGPEMRLQNPWPQFSPSGRLAWFEEPPVRANGHPCRVAIESAADAAQVTRLDLDGEDYLRFFWIDESTVLLVAESRLVVVDVASHGIRGVTPLSNEPAARPTRS